MAREALDGIRPDATLVTDRYADYNRLLCHRQFCYEHLKRDALDIARQFPHNAECQRFPARATPPAPLPRNTISQFIAPSSSLLSENLPSSGLAGKGRGSPRTISAQADGSLRRRFRHGIEHGLSPPQGRMTT
ncbi:MAG: hypothetical protein IJT88_03565 [Kiritimatiellae bacterium]|nr:hypothetical protein [Kiritimatiellia bacterium]